MTYVKHFKNIFNKFEQIVPQTIKSSDYFVSFDYKNLYIIIYIRNGIKIDVNKYTSVETNLKNLNQEYIKELKKQIKPITINELLEFLETEIEKQVLTNI